MRCWTLVLIRDVKSCNLLCHHGDSVWPSLVARWHEKDVIVWRTLHTRTTWSISTIPCSFTLLRKPSQIRHAVMSKIAWLCSHNYHSMLTTVRNACLNPGLICIDLSMTTWCLLLNSVMLQSKKRRGWWVWAEKSKWTIAGEEGGDGEKGDGELLAWHVGFVKVSWTQWSLYSVLYLKWCGCVGFFTQVHVHGFHVT